jgi:hypothetical protein
MSHLTYDFDSKCNDSLTGRKRRERPLFGWVSNARNVNATGMDIFGISAKSIGGTGHVYARISVKNEPYWLAPRLRFT